MSAPAPFPGPYTRQGRNIVDINGQDIALVYGNGGVPSVAATAALLAAAWDMREALRLVLNPATDDDETLAAAADAIAKAEGRA